MMVLGGYSETGPREANEDSFFVRSFEEIDSFSNGVNAFFMVSDGMGGYQGGDVASSMVVSSADRYVENLLAIARDNRIEFEPDVALREIVQNAHEAIVVETEARGNSSMGATFVGVFASSTHAWIGHVGDSRAYLIKDGTIAQLTEDHSQVGRMQSQGILTEEEAQNHPLRNRIERALGFVDHDIDITETDFEEGDSLLLVSDGAYTVLGADELASCVNGAKNAEQAAKRVVKEALKNHTDDNTTAVVALNKAARPVDETQRIETIPTGGASQPTRRLQRPTQKPTTATAVLPKPARSADGAYARSALRDDAAKRPKRRNASRGAKNTSSLIPFAVLFVLLIGVVVVVGIMATMRTPTPTLQEPTSTELQNTSVQDGQSSVANTTSSDTGSSVVSAPPATEAIDAEALLSVENSPQESFVVTDLSARVRFVSESGEVQLATEVAAGSMDVTIGAQSLVDAYSQTVETGGTTYRVLTKQYAAQLKDDCVAYGRGVRTFESEISGLINNESYLALLSSLISAHSIENLEQSVSYLALLDKDVESVDATQSMGVQSEGAQSTGAQGERTQNDAPNTTETASPQVEQQPTAIPEPEPPLPNTTQTEATNMPYSDATGRM